MTFRLLGKLGHDLRSIEVRAGVRILITVIDRRAGIDRFHRFVKDVIDGLLQALIVLVKARRHLQPNNSLAILAFGP